MPSDPTPEQREEWKRLAEALPPDDEWFFNSYNAVHSSHNGRLYRALADEGQQHRTAEEWNEALYAAEPVIARVPALHGDTATGLHYARGQFIAASRTAVPALLQLVERLEKRIADLEAGLQPFAKFSRVTEMAGMKEDGKTGMACERARQLLEGKGENDG